MSEQPPSDPQAASLPGGGARLKRFAVWLLETLVQIPLTTAIVGVFFRHRLAPLYPLVTTLLFLAHANLFVAGWRLPSVEQLQLEIGGAVVVLVVTSVGNLLLRRWTHDERPPERLVSVTSA